MNTTHAHEIATNTPTNSDPVLDELTDVQKNTITKLLILYLDSQLMVVQPTPCNTDPKDRTTLDYIVYRHVEGVKCESVVVNMIACPFGSLQHQIVDAHSHREEATDTIRTGPSEYCSPRS